MILERDFANTESSGFTSTKTAEIKATPAMLRMLSSGIYSDKISAFIRELSTNAYDAMVEAGTIKDNTFDVHLPTKLEPWFSIRDKGTGLSTAGMENNFSNFGDGTKAESNVYNGAFGLGSKSPLSYTRDFTIISYYKGQKTFYNYGLNDENIPVLSTAFTQPSDEPSGLEIQIAINNNDIEEVQRKAELIYRYFDKRPNTNIEIDYHELPKLIEGDGWFLTKPDIRKYSYGNSDVTTPTRVIMGNVIYPITSNGLSSDSPIYPMTQIPFVIKVELGDVQMTPSRETLEMTPKTIKFLEDVFKVIMSELSSNLEKKLDQSLCIFDKVISSFDLMNILPSGIRSCQIDKFNIPSNQYSDIFTLPKDFHAKCKFKRISKLSSYNFRKTQEFILDNWRPMNTMNYMFVFVDSSKRIGTILDTLKAKHDHVYIIRPNNPQNTKSKVSAKDFQDMCKKFLESCGNPKHIWSSVEEAKLPPVVRAQPQPKVAGAVAQPRPKGNIKAQPVTCQPNYITREREKVIQGTDTGTYYYITSYRGYLLDSSGKQCSNLTYCLQKVIQDLETKLGSKINVVSVTGTYIERVKKDSRFINLLEEVKKHNFTIEVSVDYKAIQDVVQRVNIDGSVRRELQNIKSLKMGELFSLHTNTRVDNNTYYKDIFTNLNYTFKDSEPIDLTEHKLELEKYKDLQYLNYKTPLGVIKEFIEVIDNRQNIKLDKKD